MCILTIIFVMNQSGCSHMTNTSKTIDYTHSQQHIINDYANIYTNIDHLYNQLSRTGFDITQLTKVKAWLKIVYLDDYGFVDDTILEHVIDDYLYETALNW